MEPKTIEGLRQKLFTAKVLGEVADYFFDLMEDGEFIKLGKPQVEVHPVLESILAQLSARYSASGVGFAELKLIRVEEYQFIHGTCWLNQMMGMVMFFEADLCGMFSMTLPNGKSEMARFGTTPVHKKPERKPSAN